MWAGQKIFNCEGDVIELEDAEYKFLEKAIIEPRHIALAMMHIYTMMGIEAGN